MCAFHMVICFWSEAHVCCRFPSECFKYPICICFVWGSEEDPTCFSSLYLAWQGSPGKLFPAIFGWPVYTNGINQSFPGQALKNAEQNRLSLMFCQGLTMAICSCCHIKMHQIAMPSGEDFWQCFLAILYGKPLSQSFRTIVQAMPSGDLCC